MPRTYTTTEARVLQAMRLRDQVAAEDIAADIAAGRIDGAELAHADRVLQTQQAIMGTINDVLAAGRRRSSERDIYNALQRLVARGDVRRDTLQGMGGGMTFYMRVEA